MKSMSGWSVRKYITIGKRVLITDSFKFQPDSGGRVVPNAPRGAYTCTERRYGVETTSFPKIFDLEVTLGLDMAGRFATAYSTNGYLLERTVRWLECRLIVGTMIGGSTFHS